MFYFVIHKPFGVISQFSPEHNHRTLADLSFAFPKDCYPIGRLDTDSEGLLIISNDKSLNDRLLNPKNEHKRSYWVQVEGMLTEDKIKEFSSGLRISINGKAHNCKDASIKAICPEGLVERIPPIRFRKSVPDTWVEITISEGKNRQVRRMTAAIGLPTLRLIRIKIEDLSLGNMQSGDIIEYDQKTIYSLLKMAR